MVITKLQFDASHWTKNTNFGLLPHLHTERILNMPAFVTAFSSDHFDEGRSALYNFNETVRR